MLTKRAVLPEPLTLRVRCFFTDMLQRGNPDRYSYRNILSEFRCDLFAHHLEMARCSVFYGHLTGRHVLISFADAILDRLVHNSYKITLKGGSMRSKNT